MENTFFQWVMTQVGLAGVASLALYFNNKQSTDASRRERENADTLRTANAELLKALNENTRAMTGLQSAIEALTYERARPQAANDRG